MTDRMTGNIYLAPLQGALGGPSSLDLTQNSLALDLIARGTLVRHAPAATSTTTLPVGEAAIIRAVASRLR